MAINLDYGKVPPQEIEFEEAVLGAIMIEKDSIEKIISILNPDSFYKESNRILYNSIINLYSKNDPIDILMVTKDLKEKNKLEEVGGALYVSNLTNKVASASNIIFHAMIIHEKYVARELIRISTEITQKSFDESIDISNVIEFADTELFRLTNKSVSNDVINISQVGKSEINKLVELQKSETKLSGLQTGLTTLDRLTNGFQNNDLIILAGRPSMGKTTMALIMLKNIAFDFKKSVAFFSLEMGREQIWAKLISSLTSIEVGKLREANFEDHQWNLIENGQAILESNNFFIDDTAGISISEIRAKARQLKKKHDIKILVIDYLQLITNKNSKGVREQEISEISRTLKIIAKELNIPVIALSQLNRSVEQRPDKKPNLSDLRESGAIEQDADLVAFVYRPEYYGFLEYEETGSTKNIVELLIRKHRNGKIGEVQLMRDDGFTNIFDKDTFADYENSEDFDKLEPNVNF